MNWIYNKMKLNFAKDFLYFADNIDKQGIRLENIDILVNE